MLNRWIEFWIPRLEEARRAARCGPISTCARPAEWIMRMMLSLVTVPSLTVDLDDPEAVRRFVRDHIVRGFQP